MRRPWRQRAKPINRKPMVSRELELETTKEIPAEVFHALPGAIGRSFFFRQ